MYNSNRARAFISNFRAYDNMHKIPQNDLINAIIDTYVNPDNDETETFKKKFERIGAFKHIKLRQSVKSLKELVEHCFEDEIKYEERLHKMLVEITENLLKDNLTNTDDLSAVILTTTCGAPFSPSPVQEILSKYGSFAKHLHLYQMDCYGALPTFTTANAISNTLKKKEILSVLHIELSSAYFRAIRKKNTGNFICDSLFGDGCIAYDIMPSLSNDISSLELISIDYRQWKNSLDYITICHRTGDVELHRQLSELIGNCCGELFDTLCESLNYNLPNASNVHIAVHAGGPSLLDVVKLKLNLREEQMDFAWSTLKEKGNLESATVIYQLKDILASDKVMDGDYVLLLAFGPGITAGHATFRVRRPQHKLNDQHFESEAFIYSEL